jgi:hypothetical protein
LQDVTSPKQLLAIISIVLTRYILEERSEDVERIVASIKVDKGKYVDLLVQEVIENVWVDAQFAFPPHILMTPEEVKNKALKVLKRKISRDMRLYVSNKIE